MTVSDAGEVPSNLRQVPSVTLKCEPFVVEPGAAFRCRLTPSGELPTDLSLALELVAVNGARILALNVTDADAVSVRVPDSAVPGSYEVRLLYRDWILDTFPVEVADKATQVVYSAVTDGIDARCAALESLRRGNANEALALTQRAAELYKVAGSLEAAARSWRDVAAGLTHLGEPVKAVQAAAEAIQLYNAAGDRAGVESCVQLLGEAADLSAASAWSDPQAAVAPGLERTLAPVREAARACLESVRENTLARANLERILREAERPDLYYWHRLTKRAGLSDLSTLIRESEPVLRRVVGRNRAISLRVGPEPILVKADPFDLQLVLLNLVQNAGKFVPRGGDVSISLSVVETQLQGSSRVSEPSAVVAVSETAMRPSLLERIFGPTFSTRRLGIGLAIASRIIERTGGRVQIASEPQKEKAIKCSWPLVSEATARVQIATRAWRNAPVARNTVLIVDEERSLRELLKQVFSNYGYHVLEASNASEALGVAKHRGQPIDLLVTDLVMPAMTGVELATKLAAEEPGLRVLFLSGHVSESPGFDHPLESSIDLIDEPIEADVLYRKVEGVITK